MCENTVSYLVLEVRQKKRVTVLLFELIAATFSGKSKMLGAAWADSSSCVRKFRQKRLSIVEWAPAKCVSQLRISTESGRIIRPVFRAFLSLKYWAIGRWRHLVFRKRPARPMAAGQTLRRPRQLNRVGQPLFSTGRRWLPSDTWSDSMDRDYVAGKQR